MKSTNETLSIGDKVFIALPGGHQFYTRITKPLQRIDGVSYIGIDETEEMIPLDFVFPSFN